MLFFAFQKYTMKAKQYWNLIMKDNVFWELGKFPSISFFKTPDISQGTFLKFTKHYFLHKKNVCTQTIKLLLFCCCISNKNVFYNCFKIESQTISLPVKNGPKIRNFKSENG